MSVLATLQQKIVARLMANDPTIPSLVPNTGAIDWVTEDKGDFANIIQRQVAKLGIVGIVMTPGGGKLYKEGIYPISFACAVEIQTQENVTINRGAAGTQIASLDLIEFIMQRLHLWSSHGGMKSDRLQLDPVPYLLVSETPILTYNVRFTAPITIGK